MNVSKMSKERHILGISEERFGKGLAVYMSQKFPELDNTFTDTGEELPEVYSYLTKLEG